MSSPYRMHTNAFDTARHFTLSAGAPPTTTGSSSSAVAAATHQPPPASALAVTQYTNIQELAAINTKMRGLDDRMDKMERSLSKVLSKVDQQGEKMEADSRALEMMRISLRELEQNLTISTSRSDQATDKLVNEVISLSKTMDAHEDCLKVNSSDTRSLKRALEALEGACAALKNQRQSMQSDLLQDIRNAEARLGTMFSSSIAETNRKISQSVRVVQAHVKTSIGGLNDDLQHRFAEVERDRQDMRGVVEQLQNSDSSTKDKLGELRTEVEGLGSSQRKASLSLTHMEEDIKTLNRRLMSALRHLGNNNSSGSGGVGFGGETSSFGLSGGANATTSVAQSFVPPQSAGGVPSMSIPDLAVEGATPRSPRLGNSRGDYDSPSRSFQPGGSGAAGAAGLLGTRPSPLKTSSVSSSGAAVVSRSIHDGLNNTAVAHHPTALGSSSPAVHSTTNFSGSNSEQQQQPPQPTPDIDQFLAELDGLTRSQLGMA